MAESSSCLLLFSLAVLFLVTGVAVFAVVVLESVATRWDVRLGLAVEDCLTPFLVGVHIERVVGAISTRACLLYNKTKLIQS